MPKKKAKRQAEKKLPTMPKRERLEPLWKGPEVDGVTQSMLSTFLVCPERFRVSVIEGLGPADTFRRALEYGSMWHECEEALAGGGDDGIWRSYLLTYTMKLLTKYPLQQEQVQHWYHVCKMQFPFYLEYWAKHKDVKARTPLLSEKVFCVPYTIPSGRVVLLKGKWDSVDIVGKGHNQRVWLQENKTKGDIKEELIQRNLGFDLQTMTYVVALLASGETQGLEFGGVRYNVVRRPLSGGKGSIRQHKPTKKNPLRESLESFYHRLGLIIQEDPSYFFMRWNVQLSSDDIERFKQRFLNPTLERLCIWYDWVSSGGLFDTPNAIHWQYPFGVWNPIDQSGASELDEYLATGSKVGLERKTTLFPELEDA